MVRRLTPTLATLYIVSDNVLTVHLSSYTLLVCHMIRCYGEGVSLAWLTIRNRLASLVAAYQRVQYY